MDLNMTVLCGSLACVPTMTLTKDNSQPLYVHMLITVKQTTPRHRIDVIPVDVYNDAEGFDELAEFVLTHPDHGKATTGYRVWVAGQTQRSFFPNVDGSRSKLRIIAHAAELREATET